MHKVTGYCLFIVLLLSQAVKAENSADSDYSVIIGIEINSVDFDVYNEGSTDSNGTLSEDFSYSPLITLTSPTRQLADSNWGSKMEYSFSSFQLNQQTVNNDLVDLGTSVKGYYAFVTPTLFYTFTGVEDKPYIVTTGIGIGLGYLKADGDIIFTETTLQQHDISISGAALAISLFVDYRQGNYFSRISSGLTSHTSGNYDYDSFGFSWSFSYLFTL